MCFSWLIAAAYLHFKCRRHKIHFEVKIGRFQAAFAIKGQWRFLLDGVMINVNKLRNCRIAVVNFFQNCFDNLFPAWVDFFSLCLLFRCLLENYKLDQVANPTLAGCWVGALCESVFFFALLCYFQTGSWIIILALCFFYKLSESRVVVVVAATSSFHHIKMF